MAPNPAGHVDTLTPYRSKWNSGRTQTIRVPSLIADRVLAVARRLDQGKDICQPDRDTLEWIADKVLADPVVTRNGKDRASVRRALESFINHLCQ